MKKLIIKSKTVVSILKALGKTDNSETLDVLNKAIGHKYIRRWPKKTGKGWDYLYPKDFLHPIKALFNLFGFKKEKIEDDYTKNKIKKDYGADKKTFAAHVLEYFSNKLKWDTFFSKKENQDKYKAPKKTPPKKAGGPSGAGTDGVAGDPASGSGKNVDKGKKRGDNKSVAVNKTLMKKIWGMYSGAGVKDGADQSETGQGKLPATAGTVQPGENQGNGNRHGAGAVQREAGNGGNAVQLPVESGERSGRDVRLTKKQAKDIRQACIDLLNSKSDSEMTEEDKNLLRQYEGAGGLGSEDASAHGTLYEFYTPRTVTKKVWEIVDKYIPGAKSVLEPSAGIGRFAEDRPLDKFTLNEYDKTSSRIAGILNPDAEVKQGAFQEMFKPGKDYTGRKYDVVIGNPPYGKYEGIWKGRGEGKGHQRYEEYFIDRGLDTLREGGIMAFVVPSAFLRGGNDKIKEKIAGKGRLLEAWRLPNGTFNTTGVGTDIIIIRKEKGDPAQFSNNAYFDANPQMVAGDETVRTGRYGEEKYVGLKEGVTFDEAIEGINAGVVEAVPLGEKTTKEKLIETVTIDAEESEAEKHKNRSDAMLGNQNAKKDGNDTRYATGKMHLQWVGEKPAIEASKVNVGDTLIWNGGSTSKVIAIRERGQNQLVLTTEIKGKEYERTVKKDTMLVVEGLQFKPEESEAEKHANQSRAMQGNQNAKKAGIDALERIANGADVVKDAMQRAELEELGGTAGITFYWGEGGKLKPDGQYQGGYGFQKIIEKHGIEDAIKVIETIANGEIGKPYGVENGKRVDIVNKDHQTTISLYKDKKSESWVLTGFTIDENTDAKGRGSDLTSATQTSPIRTRADLGAALSSLSISPITGELSTEITGKMREHDVDTLEEFNKKYNRHFDPQDLQIMRHTRWDGSIDLSRITLEEIKYLKSSGNYVDIGEDTWVSIANFASGNIYQKLDDLEKAKDEMAAVEYKRKKDLLEAALPVKKTVFEFTASPISDFAEEYRFEEQPGEPWRFLNAEFKRWFMELDSSNIPNEITKNDILDYVNRKAVRAEKSDDKVAGQLERQQTIRVRRETAENLFNQFIREQLPVQEQERMADKWNRQFNGTVQPDHTKIPAFVDGISKSFKGKPLQVSDIQLKGVGTLVNRGNGILAYDVGVGKLNPLSEPVLTPKGWTTIGELKEGDYVIAVDGTPTKVLKIYPQGELDIYKVKFSDGSASRCGYEHLWDVQYPYQRSKGQCYGNKANEWTTLTTREIDEDMKRSARGNRKYTIPMCEPVQFEKKELPIPPYALGYLLGNAYFGQRFLSVVIPDESVKDKIGTMLPFGGSLREGKRPIDFYLRGVESWKKALSQYGLAGKHSFDKFIPDDYQYSCVDDRVDLLRGLMDSDGTAGGGTGNTPIFYTTSRELAENMKELVQSLGGIVKIHEKQGKYKKDDGEVVQCRLCYCVTIRLKGINPFYLSRKAEKYVEHTKYFPVRFIESIKYSHKEESACILVDHPRHLFVTNDYIVTHNTLTGILATVSQIQTGRAKRPLICVPKAVYKNWISEIKQLFPGIKVNELNNLRDLGSYKNANGSLNIPDGSLSVCTYEGLQALAFEEDTINGILMADFMASQKNTGENDSERKQAQEFEKIRTALGKSTKSTDNSVLWEKTGFDHITIDEMHNMKNVFGEARAKEKGEANEFQGLTGGTPSDRAMKTFAITQLIQRDNNGRNVFGLTATPFTNSPIEIYNILSLVARDELKRAGIFNLHEFMAQFALLKSELAQTAKGDVQTRTVMKEFKNLPALQNLINTYIDKVDGEEAGIIRPNKTPHLVDITMTEEQKAVYEDIIRYMDTADPKEDPGATLRGLNALRALTVSPALLKGTRFAKSLSGETDFVKSSPKMTFVCDSAAKLYKDNPKNGQVIYLPEGVEYFKDVRKYLAKKGIPEDAVAFLSPEYLPAGDKGNDRKEEIMKDFNDPDGKIKVIIGSSTIKEGVNLNGNTTTLYNCMLGWNPTETVQVEGRIHRQGNKQGEVHIVYPLMNDTVDSFMYQKHDEKSKRISAVFSYKGDTLPVDGIDPEELKFNLIKDPAKRADLKIKQDVEEIKNRVLVAQSTADKIINTYRTREELVSDMREYAGKVSAIKQAAKEFAELSDAQLIERYGNKDDDEDESFDVHMEEFSGIRGSSWIEAKNPKEFRKMYERMGGEIVKFLQRQVASAKGKAETLAATLKRYNVDPNSEESAMSNSKKYGVEAAELNDKIDKIKQNRDRYIEDAKKQLEAYAKEHPGKTVTEAIEETTANIRGKLRSMDEVEKEIRAAREAAAQQSLKKSIGNKKKMVLLMKRRSA